MFLFFTGLLIDRTGDFGYPFLTFGLVQVVGGLVGILLYVLQLRKPKTPLMMDAEEMTAINERNNNE